MGYYTLHKISIINKHNNIRNLERLLKVIEEVTNYDYRIEYNNYDEKESYIIDDEWNDGHGSKWYSFDEDIFVISERLPKLAILIEAREENGYTWEKIVKGGYSYNYINEDEDNEEDEEDEDNEENEEDEENVQDNVEIINDNNYFGIEEIFREMKINDDEIFRR